MRYVLDFGSSNGWQTPPVFAWYRDVVTKADLPLPIVYADTAPAWTYYFDQVFPIPGFPNVDTIEFGITLNGVEESGVFSSSTTSSTTTSPPTTPPVSPTAQQMALSDLRDAVRERSDTQSDPHITDSELTRWINGSLAELYDLLIKHGGEDYYTAQATITTDGATDTYPLPDGTLYGGAPAFYKGMLVEWQFGSGPQGWVTLQRFNLREKNRWNVPPYVGVGQGSALGRVNLRYRVSGSSLLFVPLPSGGQAIRMWYAPRLSPLVQDTDVADGISGWLDYVIVDAARKAVIKQERDPSPLIAEKAALLARIEEMSQNRDQGEPATVTETATLDGGWAGDPFWPFTQGQ